MESAPLFHPTRSKYLVFTADYLLPTLITLSVLAVFYLLRYTPLFQVEEISCQLDYQPCSDPSLLVEIDKLKGQNIFTVSTEATRLRLTSGDYTIRSATITKKLPRSLAFDLQSVYPVVALQVIGDTKWVVLDERYRVIGKRDQNPNVPTVLVSNTLSLQLGKPPSDQLVLTALDLARTIANELFSVKTITLLNDTTIELVLQTGLQALLSPQKDLTAQLRVLQAILGDATMTQDIRSVDVRFARPILRP